MERTKATNCVNNTTEKQLDQALSDYSPKDAKWDRDRSITQDMSEFLYAVQRYERWAERMDGCARSVGFGEIMNLRPAKSSKKP